MNQNKFNEIIFDVEDVFENLYSGKLKTLSQLNISNKRLIEQFNHSLEKNADSIEPLREYQEPSCSVEEYDRLNQTQWFIPKDYCPNLLEYLYGCCETDEQRKRVDLEIELFIQHGIFDVLHVLKYLVDYMRENKIVWGLGRGSSVASYCLYLIGVHKVDSLKYNLDIREFLKGDKNG